MRTLFIAVSLIVLLTVTASPALAVGGTGIWEHTKCAVDSETGGPTTACDFCDALQVTVNIVIYLRNFALIAATIMIVVGALMMMFASGSEEKFATGKKTILSAVIGMAIALGAWLIVNTVLHFLSGAPDLPWNQISCASPS